MCVSVGNDTTRCVCDSGLTYCDLTVKHGELSCNSPVLVLLFLAKELDAFVDFNVLLATDVRGLELVIRHELN